MSDLKLKVLGCGDAFCSGGRFNTSFYIQHSSLNLLVDCGATTLLALKQNQIPVQDIDVVVISHFHGDHFGGLIFLLLEEKKNKRKKPLHIVSPVGMDDKLKTAVELFYPGSEMLEELDIRFKFYASHREIKIENLMIQSFPVIHSPESLPHGIRITLGDVVVAFSGDTEWTDELLPLSDGADLFICECNFYDSEIPGHLNYTELQKHDFNSKRMILTHLGEEMLENLDKIEWEMAVDGKEISL